MPREDMEYEGHLNNAKQSLAAYLIGICDLDLMTDDQDLLDKASEEIYESLGRHIRALREMLDGYRVDISSLFRIFEEPKFDEMIILKDIEFTSICAHHLMPFSGVAHVGYVAQGRVIGLSKIARIVDAIAHRMQLQELITHDIMKCLQISPLNPLGTAVVVEAKHQCLSCRGAKKPDATMITSSMSGCFRDNANNARSEFLALIRGK